MEIFAHRGASSNCPENTLAAFQEAARLPIGGVELDVHLTKDQQLVVIHDETIDRTSNGTGFVKDMTLFELRQYDYGRWFSEQFAGETIPTLSEVLELFVDTSHHINIELKTNVFPYEGIEELVLKEVETYGLSERVILSSFDHEILQRVVQLAPYTEVAALFSDILINVSEYAKQIPVEMVHVSFSYAEREPVKQAIAQGMGVRVYTVNDIREVAFLKLLGVAAIFTDEPEKMLQYFQE